MAEEIKNLTSGIKWNAFGAVGNIVSKLIRGAIIPKLLAPVSYGLFTSIGLFTRYLNFADFGTTAYFIKEIPHYHFNKSSEEKMKFVNELYTIEVLSFILIALYLGLVSFFYSGDSQDFYKIALLLLIPATIFLNIKDFYSYYALGTQNYKVSTLVSVGTNYVSLVLTIIGIYFFGAIGGVVGLTITEMFLFFNVKRLLKISFPFKLTFSKQLFVHWKHIIKQFAVSITELFVVTIDQWFIFRLFKSTGLGLYSLGLTFGWLMESVSEIFNNATYPKLMATTKINRDKSIELINNTLFFYLLSCLLILPLLIFVVEIIVTYYLNKYSDGLKVYSLVIFLGIIKGALSLLRRGFIAMDKEKKYIFYMGINLTIFVSGYLLSLFLNLSFTEVIITTVIMNLISICILYFALINKKDLSFWKNLGLLFLAFIMVLMYQQFFRSNSVELLKFNFGFIYLGIILLIISIVVYKNKKQFMLYLK